MTTYSSQTCLTPVKHDTVNCLNLSRNCWYCAPDNLFKVDSYVCACFCRYYKGYISNIRSDKSHGVVSVNKQSTKDSWLIICSQKLLRNVVPDILDPRAVVPVYCKNPHSLTQLFKIYKIITHDLFNVAFWICYFSKKVSQIILILILYHKFSVT